MTEELNNYEEINNFTSDEKLSFWGYGEWVEEPDEVLFQYEGIQCIISRLVIKESNGHMYGGHFCGYIKVPANHPVYGNGVDDDTTLGLDAHGGITYSKMERANHWIGFDCSHCNDYSPSIEYLRKTLPELKKICEEYEDNLKKFGIEEIKKTYRNVTFCIENCKYIVKQLNEMATK